MNSTDLFSFLSENAPEDDHDSEKDTPETQRYTQKRKAGSLTRADDFPVDSDVPRNGDTVDHDVDNEHGPSVYKRQRVQAPLSPKTAPKRKVESPAGDEDIHEPGPSVPKKARMASPKPIVLDDFETEAKREVAASAGLTGSVETGTRLELKHQVRSHVFRIEINFQQCIVIRCAIKSLCLQVIITPRYLNMFHPPNLLANINSSWTLSRKCLYTLFSEMRAFWFRHIRVQERQLLLSTLLHNV